MNARGEARPAGARRAWLAPAVCVLALWVYWAPALRVPFINDDYVFLDAVRGRSWGALLGFGRLTFGWWRPLSRELHYAVLERVFGARELPFHLASFALAAAVLLVYFALARRIAGTRGAVVASAGVAMLAAWAVPMLWAAGAQELWMLLAALLCVRAFAYGSLYAAAAALVAALLSKETAVVTPGIALAVAIVAARMPVRRALARGAVLAAVCVAWALVHPTLRAHLAGGAVATTAPAPPHSSFIGVIARTLLVPLNLDELPAPAAWPAGVVVRTILSLALIAGAAWWVTRGSAAASTSRAADSAPLPRVVAAAAVWAACGWLPVLWPGLGWHPYYTLLGALGVWVAIGAALAPRRAWALAAIVVLALLRAAQGATPSLDWGTEFYQYRAATFVRFMRADLARVAPRPAPHTRFFFTRVPSNVGFLTEGAPALRVWYRDTTLWGAFLSAYAPPVAGAAAGADRFFRYDSTAGWVEIVPADTGAGARDEHGRRDHRELAAAFARARVWPAAAREYAALAGVEPRPLEDAGNAAVCFAMAGDSTAAARWFEVAAGEPGADDDIKHYARFFARYLKPPR